MSTADAGGAEPSLVQTQDHKALLDAIDDLRSAGVSRHVDLPQIIVCGNQGTGKSSVLEAVSGVRFPASTTLCTSFATELVLRRAANAQINVEIRDKEGKNVTKLSPEEGTLEKIPDTIENARKRMKIGRGARAFSSDILRIEISGPLQQHLTLVDLPGIFSSSNKEQTETDRHLVDELVKAYMKESRSIILAIISAKDEYANQKVTNFARKADPTGERTLGIITKPDDLSIGSDMEKSFFSLAKNERVNLRLGWQVLRNRKYEERESSAEERDRIEAEFFAQGIWSMLPGDRRGIAALRTKLSNELKNQIIKTIPSLMSDIKAGIEDCEKRLINLGPPRCSIEQQRLYLMKISRCYGTIIKAAVDGNYHDEFFGDSRTNNGKIKRLRAVIQDHLAQFRQDMHANGHAMEIVDQGDPSREGDARVILRQDYIHEARNLLLRSRGKELPGLFNPLIVGDLFYEQAKPWQNLVEKHESMILDSVRRCLSLAMFHVADDSTGRGLDRHVFTPTLDRYQLELKTKVSELLKPHQTGHPITYSPAFVQEVRNVRRQQAWRDVQERVWSHFNLPRDHQSGTFPIPQFDPIALLRALTERTDQDIDLHACSEATDSMLAYYKAALQVLVDNFASLAIENCLVDRLADILTPEEVARLPDEVVRDIASEPEQSRIERDSAHSKHASLMKGKKSLDELLRFKSAVDAINEASQSSEGTNHNQLTHDIPTVAVATNPPPTERAPPSMPDGPRTPDSRSSDASPVPSAAAQQRTPPVSNGKGNNTLSPDVAGQLSASAASSVASSPAAHSIFSQSPNQSERSLSSSSTPASSYHSSENSDGRPKRSAPRAVSPTPDKQTRQEVRFEQPDTQLHRGPGNPYDEEL